jgi:hypothetical protein
VAEEAGLDTVLRCDGPDQIVGVINRLLPELPAEIRHQLNRAKLHYLAAEGVQGLFVRVNGRTVAQVLADADALPAPQVAAEGERRGAVHPV